MRLIINNNAYINLDNQLSNLAKTLIRTMIKKPVLLSIGMTMNKDSIDGKYSTLRAFQANNSGFTNMLSTENLIKSFYSLLQLGLEQGNILTDAFNLKPNQKFSSKNIIDQNTALTNQMSAYSRATRLRISLNEELHSKLTHEDTDLNKQLKIKLAYDVCQSRLEFTELVFEYFKSNALLPNIEATRIVVTYLDNLLTIAYKFGNQQNIDLAKKLQSNLLKFCDKIKFEEVDKLAAKKIDFDKSTSLDRTINSELIHDLFLAMHTLFNKLDEPLFNFSQLEIKKSEKILKETNLQPAQGVQNIQYSVIRTIKEDNAIRTTMPTITSKNKAN